MHVDGNGDGARLSWSKAKERGEGWLFLAPMRSRACNAYRSGGKPRIPKASTVQLSLPAKGVDTFLCNALRQRKELVERD